MWETHVKISRTRVTSWKFWKTGTVNGAIWRYLKQFGTAEKKKENRDGKWRILTLLERICSYREHFENKDGTWCNLTVFETVWNFHEKFKRTLNGAFWWHWEQFGNAENLKKKRALNVVFERHLKRYGPTETLRTMTVYGVLTAFETIWNCRVNFENMEGKSMVHTF